MVSIIAEHACDLDLLPPKANILSLGCRGFLFDNHMESLGHHVVSVDIDKLDTDKKYFHVAISDYDGMAGIQHDRDPQATRIKEGKDVPCYTLESFSYACGIDMWDLIKCDLEGAEYQIIMSLKQAPAKQISCEFHLHTGIYTQNEMKLMEAKLRELGYEFALHQLTEAHGAGYNYWSSVFVLK